MVSQERQKRETHLQWRVQETLRLSPLDLPTQECADGGIHNPPSSEEQNATARQYKNKLRVNRILQVRAQEALLASQRVSQFRDRETKGSSKLLTHLKDVWRDVQRQRIAHLEREFAESCKSIGLSHEAALLVERNRAAKEAFVTRHAEESWCWDTLRFEQAMHQERELKGLRETGDNCAPALRRRTTESVSNVEPSLTRRYNNHGAKPKPHEKQAHGRFQAALNPPRVNTDVLREKLYQHKHAGWPIDFRDTVYVHSRHGRPASAVVTSCPKREEMMDAWHAAEARRESIGCEKAHQIELDRLHEERKLERANAATAKLLHDQRIEMLEHDVEEAFRQEEREKDRVHAASTNPGDFWKRAISAGGQERRTVYTKHKISNPLSCPGLPHTSRTCSRCRSYVELVPPPPKPVTQDPIATPGVHTKCEPDAEPDLHILVR